MIPMSIQIFKTIVSKIVGVYKTKLLEFDTCLGKKKNG